MLPTFFGFTIFHVFHVYVYYDFFTFFVYVTIWQPLGRLTAILLLSRDRTVHFPSHSVVMEINKIVTFCILLLTEA